MATIVRVIAVLMIPRHVPDVIKRAQAIIAAMTSNTHFPTPNPQLSVVSGGVSALDTAETALQTHGKGLKAPRDQKLKVVVANLRALQAYVQLVADADLEHAAEIIQSAGMSVRKQAIRTKSDLTPRQKGVSGEVHLDAKAPKARATYHWQYSTDQKTWIDVPPTMVARTVITGLTPGATYYFRHRILTRRGGLSEWRQPVSLIVR